MSEPGAAGAAGPQDEEHREGSEPGEITQDGSAEEREAEREE